LEYHSTNSGRVHKHIRLLSKTGLDLPAAFARKGLPSLIINRTDARIPSAKTYSSLHDIALKEGIPDLGLVAALEQTFETAFEEPFRSQFADCLSVYQALRHYFFLMSRVNPTRRAEIVVGSNTVSIVVHAQTTDRSSVWLNYSDWGNVLNMCLLVERGVGADFQPSVIELMSDWPAPNSFARHFDCLLLRGRPAVRLTFPKQALFAPYPRLERKPRVGAGHEDHQPGEITFPRLVGETLRTFILEYDIGIELAAEILATSPRTLQRNLAKHNTSLSEILLQEKMRMAVELLQDPSATLADIATTLGYAEQSSFSRAFQKAMGLPPGTCRRLMTSRH